MSQLLHNPVFQFVDSTGAPYAGGSLTFSASETSTPLDTYPTAADAVAGTNANSNPITLNSAGWPAVAIFLKNLPYRVVLKDSSGNTIWTRDNVTTTDFGSVTITKVGSGNPEGSVAGTAGSSGVLPTLYWDYTNNILYVCTSTGTTSTAEWTAVNPAGSQTFWTIADRVSAAPSPADAGTSYIISSSFGSFVTGQIITDDGTGEFTVTQPTSDGGWIAYVQDEDAYYQFTGSAWIIGLSSIAIQVFTGSGTYTPATGMHHCLVISTGGGGGGGGANAQDGGSSASGGGGGAGSTCIEVFSAATIGANQTVTIGAAGSAGADTGTNGGAGGDTTFGSLHTAGGGAAGAGIATTGSDAGDGGAGGTASNGAMNIPGGSGSRGSGGAVGDNAHGGMGGGSFWGGGGKPGTAFQTNPTTSAGSNATVYGGGGGGAAASDATAGAAGGTGAAGVVFVLEFIA